MEQRIKQLEDQAEEQKNKHNQLEEKTRQLKAQVEEQKNQLELRMR